MFKIMQHMRNKNGFSVSLVKYEDGELVQGFTLNSFKSYEEQHNQK